MIPVARRAAREKTEIDHPPRDAPRRWRRHGEIFSRLLFFRDRRNFYPRHWLCCRRRRRRRRHRGERKGESCGRISRGVRERRAPGRPKRQRSAGAKRMAVGREIKETIGFTTTTGAKASPCRNHPVSFLSLSLLYPVTFLASFSRFSLFSAFVAFPPLPFLRYVNRRLTSATKATIA